MNTPYKNSSNLQGNSSNLNNITSAALYPSMQSGFIPFDESTPKNKNKYQQNSRNNTPYNNPPYFSANRQNNRGGGGTGGGGGGGNWSQNRNKNFRQNNYNRNNLQFSASKAFSNNEDNSKDYKDNESNFNRPQFQHASGGVGKNRYNNFHQNNRRDNFFNNRRGGGNNRFGNNGGHNKHQENIDISEYIHPSMLEDPWKDLMERHNALNSATLNIFQKVEENAVEEETNHDSSSESEKNSSSNDEDEVSQNLL